MAIFDDSFVGTPGTTLDGFNDGPGAWTRLNGSTTQAVIASTGTGIALNSVTGPTNGLFFAVTAVSTAGSSSFAWVEGRVANVTTNGWEIGIINGADTVHTDQGYAMGPNGTGFDIVECSTPVGVISFVSSLAIGDYLAMDVTIYSSTRIRAFQNGVNVTTVVRANDTGLSSSVVRASGFRTQIAVGHPILNPAWSRFRSDVGLYPGIPGSGNVIPERIAFYSQMRRTQS